MKTLFLFLSILLITSLTFAVENKFNPSNTVLALRLVHNAGGEIRFPNAASLNSFMSQLSKQGFTIQDLQGGQSFIVNYQNHPVANANCSQDGCIFDPR